MSNANDLIDTFFQLSRLMREQMTFTADVMELSALQVYALIFLDEKQHASMSEIAQAFSIELPSATSLINKLVNLKLVTRVSDKTDRRLVRITVSTKGKELLGQIKKYRQKKIIYLLSALSETEQKQLLRITQKIILNLEKKNEK